MTSNPSIFEKAIVDSHDYDENIRTMALNGKGAKEIYEALTHPEHLILLEAWLRSYRPDELFD
jgi:hypothetical protein